MKIVFMSGGARSKALSYLLDKGENVVAVVTPEISDKNQRFLEVINVAKRAGVPVYSLPKKEVLKTLQELSPEILVSCGYTYILDTAAIGTAQYAINVHPTLLPKYRGYRSGPHVIINNEDKTGVTVHFLTQDMDRGDILVQKEVPLTVFDTQRSAYRKTQNVEPQALYEAICMIKSCSITARPQDESQATEYNDMRTPADSRIDPTKPLLELYHDIRACDPVDFPAFFEIEGQKVCIKLWRPDKPQGEEDMI